MSPFISAILLCGGSGARFGGPTPKQYLLLHDKKIAHHSLDILIASPFLQEVIVVCDEHDQIHFADYRDHPKIRFAPRGITRQESVYEGLCKGSCQAEYFCIHDGARPFLTGLLLERVIQEAIAFGAAALACPVKGTIKITDIDGLAKHTLQRDYLVEMQTPQVLSATIIKEGMRLAKERMITATDDVSLAELIGAPVKIVPSSYRNIKITTEEDLVIAKALWSEPYAAI
jgi:2-C-methyl-D-erythritol 4-phosphate cytidylyltransferase